MKKQSLFFFLAFCTCFLPFLAYGQVQTFPYQNPNVQFFDNLGAPCAGCTLSTFAAGTTTALATYSDSAGTVPNANPLTLDSAGRATIYMTSASYKFVLKSALGVTLVTQDNISAANLASTLTSLTVNGTTQIIPSTAATSGANQSGPLTEMCGNYWTGTASAADCWSWQDVLGTGSNPSSLLTLTHSGSSGTTGVSVPSLAITNTLQVGGASTLAGVTATSVTSPSNTLANVDNRIYVDGVKYPLTQTGIQQALTDACAIPSAHGDGTMVYLPPGAFTGLNLTITCPFILQGAGMGLTELDSTTGDTITISPSANFQPNEAFVIRDMNIEAAAGRPIHVNDGTFPVTGFNVQRVLLATGSTTAAAIDNVGGIVNSGFDWVIGYSHFSQGGILLKQTVAANGLVDGLKIVGNMWDNASLSTTQCISLNSGQGAANWAVEGNRGGCLGGFLTSTGTTEPMIFNNQIEQTAGTGTASGCVIELSGSLFSVDAARILGNNINQHTSATHGICLGTTTNALIDFNSFAVPNGGSAVQSGVAYFLGGHNTFSLTGTGTRTSGAGVPITSLGADGAKGSPAYSFSSCTNCGMYTRSGVVEISANNNTPIQINGTNNLIAVENGMTLASGSVDVTATDTGVWRVGASEASIGSAVAGNKGGQLDLTTIQIQSTVFASLGTPVNGTLKFCSDCTVANPCAGSGTGALAKRLNGAWVCN